MKPKTQSEKCVIFDFLADGKIPIFSYYSDWSIVSDNQPTDPIRNNTTRQRKVGMQSLLGGPLVSGEPQDHDAAIAWDSSLNGFRMIQEIMQGRVTPFNFIFLGELF